MNTYTLHIEAKIKAQNFDSAQTKADKVEERVKRGGDAEIAVAHLKPEPTQ